MSICPVTRYYPVPFLCASFPTSPETDTFFSPISVLGKLHLREVKVLGLLCPCLSFPGGRIQGSNESSPTSESAHMTEISVSLTRKAAVENPQPNTHRGEGTLVRTLE